MAEHSYNVHAPRWISARSYRYSPYPQPVGAPRDIEPSPNAPPAPPGRSYGVAPPLQLQSTPVVAYGQREWSSSQTAQPLERVAPAPPIAADRHTTVYVSPCHAGPPSAFPPPPAVRSRSPSYEQATTPRWERYEHLRHTADESEQEQNDRKTHDLQPPDGHNAETYPGNRAMVSFFFWSSGIIKALRVGLNNEQNC